MSTHPPNRTKLQRVLSGIPGRGKVLIEVLAGKRGQFTVEWTPNTITDEKIISER